MRRRILQLFVTNRDPAFIRACLEHNTRALSLVVGFLAIEQLLYGLFVQAPSSLIGRVHLFTALYAAVLFVLSHRVKTRLATQGPLKSWYRWITPVIATTFLILAILRAIFMHSGPFAIPAIYVAVLYGFSFIAFVPPKRSFLLYSGTLILFLYLLSTRDITWIQETLVADLVANNVLAWSASILAYRRFEREFAGRKVVDETNRELLRLSTTDMLTALNNRRKIDAHLEHFHELADHDDRLYSVILADIDRFKRINDRYGHHQGDEVLKDVAILIKDHIRKTDIVGRWGGEEFLVLCAGTDGKEAAIVAEKLRRAIENHSFSIPEQLTCSFGIGTYGRGSYSRDVVKWADEALYRSKAEGRNRVTICSGSSGGQVVGGPASLKRSAGASLLTVEGGNE